MLSYRHGFHAGNYADVVKHAALCFTLSYMQQKPASLLAIDSHAGAGLYDLTSAMADKTGEAAAGIERLSGYLQAHKLTAPPFLDGYFTALEHCRARYGAEAYPGSSLLLADGLRDEDRAVLVELHPTDHKLLEETVGRRRHVSVQKADSFQLLRGLLPPKEKRALLIMDPPYEVKSDYETVVEVLADAYRRLPGLVTLLWYPVVDRARTEVMLAGVSALPQLKEPPLRLELAVAEDGSRRGMTAAGVLVLNAPYTLAPAWEEAKPLLQKALSETAPQ